MLFLHYIYIWYFRQLRLLISLCISWIFEWTIYTTQKTKFSIKNFCSKSDHMHCSLRIWSHLLEKSLIGNFLFCAVIIVASIQTMSKVYEWTGCLFSQASKYHFFYLPYINFRRQTMFFLPHELSNRNNSQHQRTMLIQINCPDSIGTRNAFNWIKDKHLKFLNYLGN